MKESTLRKYARSDRLERHQGVPIYYHSAACPGFCEYACNSKGNQIADAIEKLEGRPVQIGMEKS